MRHLIFVLCLFLALVGCGGAASDSSDSSGGDTSGGDTSGADDSSGDVARVPPEEGGACPEGGAAPVEGENGLPENCAVLFEGCCYADGSDACRAAGCGDDCAIAESYPGQLGRCE